MSKEAESRTLGAAALLVRQETMRVLGDYKHPLRAIRHLDQEGRTRVAAKLNELVSELVAEILALPDETPTIAPITQRLSVLANDQPCGLCGRTTRVAIHDIQAGKVEGVECEWCAPEFQD